MTLGFGGSQRLHLTNDAVDMRAALQSQQDALLLTVITALNS